MNIIELILYILCSWFGLFCPPPEPEPKSWQGVATEMSIAWDDIKRCAGNVNDCGARTYLPKVVLHPPVSLSPVGIRHPDGSLVGGYFEYPNTIHVYEPVYSWHWYALRYSTLPHEEWHRKKYMCGESDWYLHSDPMFSCIDEWESVWNNRVQSGYFRSTIQDMNVSIAPPGDPVFPKDILYERETH